MTTLVLKDHESFPLLLLTSADFCSYIGHFTVPLFVNWRRIDRTCVVQFEDAVPPFALGRG
jgi:hypothetical protein